MTTAEASTLEADALAALRRLVGNAAADFRDGQLEAIAALVGAQERVLVVQRTGWGKSAVYFVATALLRARGAGPTLLVSPLLGLMRNQIDAARRGGVKAETINSDNTDEWEPIVERLHANDVDILLVAPERFANPRFRDEVLPPIASSVGMLVIDEAHCISDWGHDFRPDYRRLVRVLDLLPTEVPVLATTATANDRVIADVVHQLGADLRVFRGTLDRTSLALDVVRLPSQAERLAWLAEVIPRLPGTGIVYTLTVADTDRVARWLQQNGVDAVAYHGDVDTHAKQEIEARLMANELKVVVATTALGMGYDKPDLAFVVHFQSPGSVVGYYQQVGRAGRALDASLGILLTGREDTEIQDFFIRTAFPPQEIADEIVALLERAGDWVPLNQIEFEVNLRQGRITHMLKVLEVEGAVERQGRKYRRTAEPWEYPAERIAQVTAARRTEQAAMLDYIASDTCFMERLRQDLDDPGAAPCGRCAVCLGGPLQPVEIDAALIEKARRFLRSQPLYLEPRKQLPSMKRIPAGEQCEVGRMLCRYGDAGWGAAVAQQRREGTFSDELVDACAHLIGDARFEPAPTWVACVPSLRSPDLVRSFAERVAKRLELPFHPVVHKVREADPQPSMENSAQQVRNLDGVFEVAGDDVLDGPVLLLDDLVDSRWTLTMIGQLLRQSGSGEVFPIALADAQGTS